ncbi:hypothetical protein, partial [Eggerthella sinensis]|uniref:hypothetical protein n=1 Tax=Eggerthella sinensis TaxID=242230 RepID=UPI0022E512CC
MRCGVSAADGQALARATAAPTDSDEHVNSTGSSGLPHSGTNRSRTAARRCGVSAADGQALARATAAPTDSDEHVNSTGSSGLPH